MELHSEESLRAVSTSGELLFSNRDDNRALDRIAHLTVNQRLTPDFCHPGDRV